MVGCPQHLREGTPIQDLVETKDVLAAVRANERVGPRPQDERRVEVMANGC